MRSSSTTTQQHYSPELKRTVSENAPHLEKEHNVNMAQDIFHCYHRADILVKRCERFATLGGGCAWYTHGLGSRPVDRFGGLGGRKTIRGEIFGLKQNLGSTKNWWELPPNAPPPRGHGSAVIGLRWTRRNGVQGDNCFDVTRVPKRVIAEQNLPNEKQVLAFTSQQFRNKGSGNIAAPRDFNITTSAVY